MENLQVQLIWPPVVVRHGPNRRALVRSARHRALAFVFHIFSNRVLHFFSNLFCILKDHESLESDDRHSDLAGPRRVSVDHRARHHNPPVTLLEVNEHLDIFGFFLLVLIGIELLETIKACLAEHVVHVEIVLEAALIAVARKVIILDPKEYAPVTLLSIAALIVTLAIAIYIEQRARLATPLIPRTDTTSRSDTTPSQVRETGNS